MKIGNVIGINTIKITDAEGIGFAVPINLVKPIVNKFISNGKFSEGYLGIEAFDKQVIPYIDSAVEFENGIYVYSVDRKRSCCKSWNIRKRYTNSCRW